MIGSFSNKAHSRVRPLCVLFTMLFIQAANASLFAQDNVQHEYVDLGVSVKWATCNVGADKPGYTDRSIFLPKADYWSSSLEKKVPLYAIGIPIRLDELLYLKLVMSRESGHPVPSRLPVKKETMSKIILLYHI